MPTICLHDKKVLERYFRDNPELHIYSIGDLDDFFWPYTTWYALITSSSPEAIALLYIGQSLPALLALSEQPSFMSDLLESVIHLLPRRFYAHLSPGVEHIFKATHRVESHGEHYKMALKNISTVKDINCSEAINLSMADLNDVIQLYIESYPENSFDQRMLETNQFYGIWQDDKLVSIAGIHVYSERYRVAALGNITTHPSCRNNGYGKSVTARLCQSLSERVDHIGLNVKANNTAAISLYEKLGFEIIASYGEFVVQRK
jgi:GNAT superfamily N-acetyltransferase